MNLALTVLTDAAYRASTTPIDTSEVRLALRVLYPYLADQEPLLRFWSVAAMDRGPSDSCHPALHQIVAGLIERGHAVEAEFR